MVMEILGKTTFGKEAEEVGVYGTYKDYAGEGLSYSTELAGISQSVVCTNSSGCAVSNNMHHILCGQNRDITMAGFEANTNNTTATGSAKFKPQGIMLRNYSTPFSLTINYTCYGLASSNASASSIAGNISSVVLAQGTTYKDCILSYDGTNYDVTWDGTLISRNGSFEYSLSQSGYCGASITPTKIVVNSGKVVFLKTLNI